MVRAPTRTMNVIFLALLLWYMYMGHVKLQNILQRCYARTDPMLELIQNLKDKQLCTKKKKKFKPF